MRAVGFALLLAIASAACGDDPAPAPPRPRPTPPVRVDAAVPAPSRGFVGVIASSAAVDVAPLMSGRIALVGVRPGDAVTAGQVVAEMDRTSLEEERRAAEAAVGAAVAAYRQASVDVEDARRKVAREKQAVADGVSPREAYEQAVIDLKRASAAADRAAANAAAEKSRLDTARAHVGNTRLVATFDGIVQSRLRDPGATVAAGEPIVRILGRGDLRLRFAVPPERTLAVGAAVTATVDGRATPIAAKVTQVAPAIDAASGMIIIEAELDAAVASELRPSLAAWVQVP